MRDDQEALYIVSEPNRFYCFENPNALSPHLENCG
ncbi:SdiA-regulated domain-containing protein [Pseudomonas saliphila]